MSDLVKNFYVNSAVPTTIAFNNKDVKSVYYNNKLVWEQFVWTNWNNATWKDISNLCKAKQEGTIASWPSDVVIGATKTTTLSTAVLGSTAVTMSLIGIDVDGDGTLTFQAKTPLNQATVFSDNIEGWYDSTARYQCQKFYSNCDARLYIKPTVKGTCRYPVESINNPDTQYITEYVFLLSSFEIERSQEPSDNVYQYCGGIGTSDRERTKDTVRPSFGSLYEGINSRALLRKGVSYWTRSLEMFDSNTPPGRIVTVNEKGQMGNVNNIYGETITEPFMTLQHYSSTAYLLPAFVIG